MNRKKMICAALMTVLLAVLSVACGTADNMPPAEGDDESGAAGSILEASEEAGEAAAYTKYADYEPEQAVPAELIPGTNREILVAYFSRSGNTHIADGADAVSSASLTVNADGSTLGNSEQIAGWIAEETGGDLFLIQTEYTYPLD